jgi:hypothetical protein
VRYGSDIFQVRVSLVYVEPRIWRRLLVPQDVALSRLHAILQVTMGWTNSHLHQFKVGELRFAEPGDEYEPGPIDYRRITLSQIAPHRGSTCVYEYDFGDSWDHLIEVEDELSVEAVQAAVARCIGGERACPPEDCGGPSGYAEFLEAIRDPNHAERDDLLEWAGADFDPEAFDVERVNRILSRSAAPTTPIRRGMRRRSP